MRQEEPCGDEGALDGAVQRQWPFSLPCLPTGWPRPAFPSHGGDDGNGCGCGCGDGDSSLPFVSSSRGSSPSLSAVSLFPRQGDKPTPLLPPPPPLDGGTSFSRGCLAPGEESRVEDCCPRAADHDRAGAAVSMSLCSSFMLPPASATGGRGGERAALLVEDPRSEKGGAEEEEEEEDDDDERVEEGGGRVEETLTAPMPLLPSFMATFLVGFDEFEAKIFSHLCSILNMLSFAWTNKPRPNIIVIHNRRGDRDERVRDKTV